MSTQQGQAAHFQIGDWVELLYGPRRVLAQVVEDRGRLGVNQRRLYRVRLQQDVEDPTTIEIPEQDLTRAESPIPKSAILRYFGESGLVEILRANLAGGRNQPRVWLTRTPQGAVTYTFAADRGLIGGGVIPFFALHGEKIFTPKRDEVVDFLLGFGLSRPEAEDVVASVGTAP